MSEESRWGTFGAPLGAWVLFSWACLPACGPPPAPPPPTVKPPPAVTAAATSRPVFSLMGEDSPAPDCARLPATDLPPLDPPLERFEMPPGGPDIRFVIGRDERDVWLVSETESSFRVLHWDGTALRKEPLSPCADDESPSTLAIGPGGPVLVTQPSGVYWYRGNHTLRRSPAGSWACADADHPTEPYSMRSTMHRMFEGISVPLDSIPPPASDQGWVWPNDVVGQAADDFWVHARSKGVVLHWNGEAWEDRSPGYEYSDVLGIDQSGEVWLVGRKVSRPWIEQDVLRWDREAHAWACLPVPPRVDVEWFRGRSASDLWLIGNKDLLHWDGASFRRAPNPMERIDDVWLAPSGELWIVGVEEDKTKHDRQGAVFRVRPGERSTLDDKTPAQEP